MLMVHTEGGCKHDRPIQRERTGGGQFRLSLRYAVLTRINFAAGDAVPGRLPKCFVKMVMYSKIT